MTASSEAVGPRHYMAPELEDGLNLNVDERADIYSAGKLLYFILSGGRIFAREKYVGPRYRLSALYNDPRYDALDSVFRRTIVENARQRFRSAGELLEAFREVRTVFLAHPRTRLFIRCPEMRSREARFGAEGVRALDADEVAELLALLIERGAAMDDELCLAVLERLPPDGMSAYFRLFERSESELDPRTVEKVAVRVFADAELVGSPVWSLEARDASARLAVAALRANGDVVARNIGAHVFLWLRHNERLIVELAKRFQHLQGRARAMFIVECGFAEFPSMIPLLVAISERKDLDALEFEAVVGALAAKDSKAAVGRLVSLGREIDTEERIGAFVRGIGLQPHPRTLRRLRAAKWRNVVLAEGLKLIEEALKGSRGETRSGVGGEAEQE